MIVRDFFDTSALNSIQPGIANVTNRNLSFFDDGEG